MTTNTTPPTTDVPAAGRQPGIGSPLPGPALLVPEMVAARVGRHPDRIAVRSTADGDLTYAELWRRAGDLAAGLTERGVRRGDLVGVLVEPSAAMVVAALGVLRAGAGYVPVDGALPDGRIRAVLADTGVRAAVVWSATRSRLADSRYPVLVLDEVPHAPFTGEVSEAHDPAYVIHTSGSTGTPRGVLVEHAQLSASTRARLAVYPGAPAFLLLSPLCFDSSVAGLWGTLCAGGCLVVATEGEVCDPEAVTGLVSRFQVTTLLCVPSLYTVLLDTARRRGPDALAGLRVVIVAGEPLPRTLLERHFTTVPHADLVNEYGPTEAAVWATYRRFTRPEEVSIGGPVPGTRLYVLDDDLRPVPPGEEGELVIGGAGVARGYLHRPEDTARAFVHDPFAPAACGPEAPHMYRTGDRVRWNEDGTLEFRGRRDHQVKIRGHRVELGAVEEALRAQSGVRDAVVVIDEARTRLVGFVVGTEVSPDQIRSGLAARLPAPQVPAQLRVVDDLPRTVTGKVDRRRLAHEASAAAQAPCTAASTAATPAGSAGIDAQVAAAWSDVLGPAPVPAEANFFDAGGHSLTMFALQDALERRTGRRPSVVALFRHTTMSSQAALIRDDGTADAAAPGDAGRAARELRAQRARAARARRGRTASEAHG